MRLISVQIPELYLEGMDIMVVSGYYANRSEAIRIAVRDLIVKELGGFQEIEKRRPLLKTLPVEEEKKEEG
ncbi:MAG: transcriptional regulator [Methanomicrobia archaeon]|jgi:Arc/MetJ-type ribon-helix-helix transcriptional regulator|nr:transcriptional regulator [Methanomicrobia archaeon]MCK4432741.1 transcriptional regulator [Methanomicrobia archaeon]MCK4636290.1 transcriptional regulator [Methanomicrobia archaeon]